MQWSKQLFKVFQRLHPTEFEGIGIGLAIAARIVQRHGGHISARGDMGRGATFSFTLPQNYLLQNSARSESPTTPK
jgi:signal transduction histidine kinase